VADWIWLLLIVPPVIFELDCAFARRRAARTISENVRGWEKGRWYVRLIFGFLIVVLFLHIVYPQWW
jgi:hypothetical protein